jgi:hypothetical protein
VPAARVEVQQRAVQARLQVERLDLRQQPALFSASCPAGGLGLASQLAASSSSPSSAGTSAPGPGRPTVPSLEAVAHAMASSQGRKRMVLTSAWCASW